MMKNKKVSALLLAALLAGSLTACGSAGADVTAGTESAAGSAQEIINNAFEGFGSGGAAGALVAENAAYVETDSDRFTDRDLAQTADLTGAVRYTVTDGQDITITEEGVYVLSGTASDVTVIVDAGDDDKVQLVLDGLTLTNEDFPCIYGKNADKIFVTTTDSENSLSVTSAFTADGDTNTDAVIFSRDDLVLNGTGTLTISSPDNGISSKDDLKITGGTLVIDCAADGLEANDAILAAGGTVAITTDKDGLRAGDDEDDTAGEIYIAGGTFTIQAGSDGIQAATLVQIDDGAFTIQAAEGIEGTYIQINGGTIDIAASDDGINAARKSSALDVAVEINGGSITIAMGGGDTDGIDSNGDLTINGGTVSITANSPFDYDGTGSLNGGTVLVNGEEVTELTNQFMGGPGMGGFPGGQMPGGRMGGRPDASTDGDTGATPDFDGERPAFPGGYGPGDGMGGEMTGRDLWESYDEDDLAIF